MQRFKSLPKSAQIGILFSLSAIPCWLLSYFLFSTFCDIFDIDFHTDFLLWLGPPFILISLGLIVSYFDLPRRWNIRPFVMTCIVVLSHGTWVLILGFFLPSELNGYFYIFLFALGLKFLDLGFDFRSTMIFTLCILTITSVCSWAFNHQIGPDDMMFFFFCAFYGSTSAFINEFNFRRIHGRKGLKQADSERAREV